VGDDHPDTWYSRDRPVLAEILRQMEGKPGAASPGDIQAELGLSKEQYWLAIQALDAEGFVDASLGPNGPIMNVSADARRELGAWPTPENLADRIVAGLEAAAQAEKEPERKRALQSAASTVKSVGVDLFTKWLETKAGL
jgi:hypothetical protein